MTEGFKESGRWDVATRQSTPDETPARVALGREFPTRQAEQALGSRMSVSALGVPIFASAGPVPMLLTELAEMWPLLLAGAVVLLLRRVLGGHHAPPSGQDGDLPEPPSVENPRPPAGSARPGVSRIGPPDAVSPPRGEPPEVARSSGPPPTVSGDGDRAGFRPPRRQYERSSPSGPPRDYSAGQWPSKERDNDDVSVGQGSYSSKSRRSGGGVFGRVRDRIRGPRSASDPVVPETELSADHSAVGSPSDQRLRTSGPVDVRLHPRVDGPDVVLVGRTFTLVIGVAPRRDRSLITTGAMMLPASEPVELGLLVTYDPASLRMEGAAPTRLLINTDRPGTTVAVRFTVLDGEELAAERRVGVHYLREGVPIGIAWKRLLVVATETELAGTMPPSPREGQLLELAPIMQDKPPDLVIAVFRADDTEDGHFIWAAYPTVAGLTVPDLERSRYIGKDAQQFATNWRRTLETSQYPRALFTQLHGLGLAIGRAIPPGIRQVLHHVATDQHRTTAATLLLLTEEVHVPWELAAFRAPHALASAAGGQSPFLGAHVAVSRWPLTDDRPRPSLRTAVEVHHTAVISARYEGIPGWGRIIHAEQEAADLLQAYPPAVEVAPFFDEVMDCLNGTPPGEVLHFALHGRFDPAGPEEGLVVFARDRSGAVRPIFLTPVQVDAATMPGAFVFLNACQVGAAKKVLGDYAGFAVAFLRAGASGVIAPLWNIDDVAAGTVARDFYAMVYSPEAIPAAEALRRIRARYTERTAQDAVDTGDATFLAYQFFGHPGLTLTRS